MRTPKFNTLVGKLLTEMMPVGADYETFGSSLKSGISKAPGDAYLIGTIASALNVSKEDVVDMISKTLYDKVFGETGVNPANTEADYRDAIADALSDVISEIKVKHPEAKIPGASAIRGYTARVISTLGASEKKFGASEEEVRKAVAKADNPAGQEVESDEDESETVTAPKASPKAPSSFTPSSAVNYTFEPEVRAGTMSEEEKRVYDLVGKDETYTGKELIDYLSDEIKFDARKDINDSKISKVINSLINKGVVVVTTPDKGEGDIEALEAGEEDEDYAQREFERDPNLMAAYRDYKAAGGVDKEYGVDFG